MTSILKVDNIQKANGSVPKVSDLGLNVTGSVLQVKQLVFAKETITTSSATFVSTGKSLAITPSATSSKILIQVCGGSGHCPYVNQFCISTIYRGSTNLSTNGIENIKSFLKQYKSIFNSQSVGVYINIQRFFKFEFILNQWIVKHSHYGKPIFKKE